MKKSEQNLIIRTPWTEINEELRTECALLDGVNSTLTKEQAEAIAYLLPRREFLVQDQVIKQEITQQIIAKILKISQPALSQRLKNRWLSGRLRYF